MGGVAAKGLWLHYSTPKGKNQVKGEKRGKSAQKGLKRSFCKDKNDSLCGESGAGFKKEEEKAFICGVFKNEIKDAKFSQKIVDIVY